MVGFVLEGNLRNRGKNLLCPFCLLAINLVEVFSRLFCTQSSVVIIADVFYIWITFLSFVFTWVVNESEVCAFPLHYCCGVRITATKKLLIRMLWRCAVLWMWRTKFTYLYRHYLLVGKEQKDFLWGGNPFSHDPYTSWGNFVRQVAKSMLLWLLALLV